VLHLSRDFGKWVYAGSLFKVINYHNSSINSRKRGWKKKMGTKAKKMFAN
jgi:hypothetical protein